MPGHSLEQTRAFLKHIIDGSLPQMTAVVDDEVVGFCDIIPNAVKLHACLALARKAGIEKVELEVFSDNIGALRLYESCGFSEEGLRVRGRKLEGRYQHVKLMALWL